MQTNTNFILEQSSFNNFTIEELVKQAENADNFLALHIYDKIHNDVEEDFEERVEDVLTHVEETVEHILELNTKTAWIKVTDNSWHLQGFHRDCNVHNHGVTIESKPNKCYLVIIEHGEQGEEMHERSINGLKAAKEYAIKWAIRYALRNEMRI